MRSAPTDRNYTICEALGRNVGSSIRHPSYDCATSAQKDQTFAARKEAPVIGRRLGGASKAIRVMKESWDSPAGRARGSFQRVVRDFAGEGLFLCLSVIKVAGVVAIHSVTSALAGDS